MTGEGATGAPNPSGEGEAGSSTVGVRFGEELQCLGDVVYPPLGYDRDEAEGASFTLSRMEGRSMPPEPFMIMRSKVGDFQFFLEYLDKSCENETV